MARTKLEEKIASREAIAGVIGLGYVGLPLAMAYNDAGYRVVGFDINDERVEMTNEGVSQIDDVPSERLKRAVDDEMMSATNDMAQLADVDIIVICVPTPLTPHREPDVSYLENTSDTIAQYLRKGQLIIVESTVYPGATREVVLPRLEGTGLAEGEDFFLSFSPERVDPGNKQYTIADIPKVIGGASDAATELTTAFYEPVVTEVVPVSSPEAAEMSKLLENTYRAVNIALVNELKVLCHRMGLDVFEVIDAAKTKPYGFEVFYPGPGVGGHCIPLDPFYLTWKARENEYVMHFVERAGEVNWLMPRYVVDRLIYALNERGRAIKGANVLVLGIAYKADVDDMRESPALPVMEQLMDYGANLAYHDPYIAKMPDTRKYQFGLESVSLDKNELEKYDAAIIITMHKDVDYKLVFGSVPLVVDTRGIALRMGYTGDNVINA
ncbi:MAG: nucleotide sugar dehydrogenase [bacterium]|nr:nucleotide sugar dehydrogenase [bacterium]